MKERNPVSYSMSGTVYFLHAFVHNMEKVVYRNVEMVVTLKSLRVRYVLCLQGLRRKFHEKGHCGCVRAVACGGRYLATGSTDETIK